MHEGDCTAILAIHLISNSTLPEQPFVSDYDLSSHILYPTINVFRHDITRSREHASLTPGFKPRRMKTAQAQCADLCAALIIPTSV
jgi:hypothetical protein